MYSPRTNEKKTKERVTKWIKQSFFLSYVLFIIKVYNKLFDYTYSLSNILKLQVIAQWKIPDLKKAKKRLVSNIVNTNNVINIQLQFKNKIIFIIILAVFVNFLCRTKYIRVTFAYLMLTFSVTLV